MAAKPTVLLTGASKGLGFAIAKILLGTFNANVIALSRTRGPDLQALADAHGDALMAVECDVADEAALRAAVARGIDKYKALDGVILNAGVIEPLGPIASEDTTLDQWRKHFDVNVFSLVAALKATVPTLRKSTFGGRVVFVSSGAATGYMPTWGAYNAGKAALNSLCRTIAREEPDVTFVSLRPGMVNTAMQEQIRNRGGEAGMPPEFLGVFTGAYETGKLVDPYDAGHVVAALALRAPQSISGDFVDWSGDACKEFRRQ
ncbi:short-chain dehydrogenase [Epithele typhae]|uniref:short-chain dehydrogenase n=1 Tax=Epithele typhae TaxID=378194 RepID=UPI002007B5F7|nr:short-chain dehydrogenase [Epithele typhae]KAH9943474.1 short-chain dehydrogenase [Epithele typhae]